MKPILVSLIILFSAVFSFGESIKINEIMSSNSSSILDKFDKKSDWIELYNPTDEAINLIGYSLTDKIEDDDNDDDDDDDDDDDLWIFPNISIQPKGFLLIFASGKDILDINELHTNFKIKSSGEIIVLRSPDGTLIDSFSPIALNEDKTYGRLPDGSNNLTYLNTFSPATSNNTSSEYENIAFSHESGFYETDFDLTISGSDSIFYTIDGSDPTLNSHLFSNSLRIQKPTENFISLIQTSNLEYDDSHWITEQFGFRTPTSLVKKAVVLKAQSFKNGIPTSNIFTKTFFMEKNEYDFDLISIVTDSLNLFQIDTGIYVPGTNHNTNNPDWTGNYFRRGREWERKAHVEFFNKEGKLTVSSDVGIRISGQKSRSHPQKSLRLYFRSSYGLKELDLPLFEEREYSKFKRLILRSSFTYWNGRNSTFQDDFIHSFAHKNDFNLDVMPSKPSIVFINGELWGIQNIRERQDKYYYSTLYDVDEDSVNIVAGNLSVEEGSSSDFLILKDFILDNDLSLEENYDYVKQKMDIPNYIDYFVLETFFGNVDWPVNNLEMWKPEKTNTKWRWVLYDLDATMGDSRRNPFQAFETFNTNVQVQIFNNLMTNETFKTSFRDRYIYHLENNFKPTKSVALFESFENMYNTDIQQHVERWKNPESFSDWESGNEELKYFLEDRPCEIKYFLIDTYGFDTLDLFDCLYTNTTPLTNNESRITFQNPVQNEFRLKILDTSLVNTDLYIMDSKGKTVLTDQIKSTFYKVNINTLPKGMYIIKILGNNQELTDKLIIL